MATKKTTPEKSAPKKATTKAAATTKKVASKAPAKTTTVKAKAETAKAAPAKKTATKPVAKKAETPEVEPVKKAAAKKETVAKKPAKAATTVVEKPAKKPAAEKKVATKPVETPVEVKPELTGMRQVKPAEAPAAPAPISTASVRQPLKPNYEIVHPKGTGKKKTTHRQVTRSPFKDSELEEFKQRLLDERAKKVKLQYAMSHDALSRPDEENVEEDGSNSANRADMLTRAEETRKRLRAIDDALRAIENKTYGICSVCGCAISKERLKAAPFAIRCVKCKAEWERQMQQQQHQ